MLFCSFISLTEKVLHEISLVEIVGCTLNICFLGYYVIMVGISRKTIQQSTLFCDNIRIRYIQITFPKIGIFKLQEWEIGEFTSYITYVILLITFTFDIFIFCYIGELVAEQV